MIHPYDCFISQSYSDFTRESPGPSLRSPLRSYFAEMGSATRPHSHAVNILSARSPEPAPMRGHSEHAQPSPSFPTGDAA